MKRSLFPRAFLFGLALCAVAAGGALPAVADGPAIPVSGPGGPGAAAPAGAPVAAPVAPPAAEASPFAPLVERIALSEPAMLGTQTMLLLWTPREAAVRSSPSTPRPWVGLAGTDARVLDLPAPIGDVLVHVTNPLSTPLYLPRGEALVPPFGPARVVDRPVWIGPGTSVFVPVVQTSDPPAAGPYSASEERPSPDSLRALRVDTWATFVATQTLTFEHAGQMTLDPLRGYAIGVFPKDATVPFAAVEALRLAATGTIVGFALGDGVGPTTIVLESDAARLRVQWTAIARGIALDEITRRRRGMPTLPQAAGFRLVAAVGPILRELAAPPALRPAFGEGDQARWPAEEGQTARWIGLVVDGAPITATFHRREAPGPVPGPPGTTPGTPPTPPTESGNDPGQAELERRGARNAFEERLKERREGRGDGGGGERPPAPAGGAGGTGPGPGNGAGGAPAGSPGGSPGGGSPGGGSAGGGSAGGGAGSTHGGGGGGSPSPGGGGPGGGSTGGGVGGGGSSFGGGGGGGGHSGGGRGGD